METLALIIPARMGAQRLPRKPLAAIRGVPLVVRTAQQGQKFLNSLDSNDFFGKLTVATDHSEIFDTCKEHDIPVVMTDEDLPSGSDRVLQAAKNLQFPKQQKPSLLLNLQGDEPFMPLSCLRAILSCFQRHPQGDLFTAAKKCTLPQDENIYRDPNAVKVITDNQEQALYFSRAPIPHGRDTPAQFNFLKHMGVYLWKRHALEAFVAAGPSLLEDIERLEQLRAMSLGQNIFVTQGDWNNLDINTAADLEAAERFHLIQENSEEC